MSTKFEVITFTASQECYAEALLKIIDPEKKFIKHRYYRDSCVPVFGNYVKVCLLPNGIFDTDKRRSSYW